MVGEMVFGSEVADALPERSPMVILEVGMAGLESSESYKEMSSILADQ